MLLLEYYTLYEGWRIIVKKKRGDLDCLPDLGNVMYYIGLGYS